MPPKQVPEQEKEGDLGQFFRMKGGLEWGRKNGFLYLKLKMSPKKFYIII
jgi:hypothetical protein